MDTYVTNVTTKRKIDKHEEIKIKNDVEMASCPLCYEMYPITIIAQHADQCKGKTKKSSNIDLICLDGTSGQNTQKKRKIEKGTNAFSKLMATSRLSAQRMVCFVRSDGKCDWKLGINGKTLKEMREQAEFNCVYELGKYHLKLEIMTETSGTKDPIAILFKKNRSPWEMSKFSISVLKSCLQKSIRRGDAKLAVALATELMCKDFSQFIRRFTVIMLEDAVLHPDLDFMVVLMILTHKSYAVPWQYIEKCLVIVKQVALCPFQDCFFFNSKLESAVSLTERIQKLPVDSAKLIRCLQIRSEYGGMTGDMDAFRAMSQVWLERFELLDKDNNSIWITDCLNQLYPQEDLPDEYMGDSFYRQCSGLRFLRNASDRLLPGIDFHCCPWISSNALEAALRDNNKEMKEAIAQLRIDFGVNVQVPNKINSAMWNFRSGLNFRSKPCSDLRNGNSHTVDQLAVLELNIWKDQCEKGRISTMATPLTHNNTDSKLLQLWKAVSTSVDSESRNYILPLLLSNRERFHVK